MEDKEHEAGQREERLQEQVLEGADARDAEGAQQENEEEEEGPVIIEDWKVMHEPVSGKGRMHPGVVQPEEMVKNDPKMHELPIF